MKKNILSILALFLIMNTQVYGRTILTTLPLYYAPYHYPLDYFQDDKNWYVDIRGGAYYRSANQAFSDCEGTCKVPFSTLIFGVPDFTIAETFTDATISPTEFPGNPFVSIATLSPRFDYREHGAVFGVCGGARFGCEERWHAGARARLPIREIDVKEICGGSAEASDLTGESLAAVYQQRQETNDFAGSENSNTVFAARLDFLSALNRVAVTATGSSVPMVIYSDPDNSGHISIAAVDATGQQPSVGPLQTNQPPVAVIDSTNGSVPTSVRWGNLNSSITGVVAANGSGLTNLERGRFASDVTYTPLGANTPAQRQLFVVPTINDSGASAGQMTAGSRQIQNAINAAILSIDTSVEAFLLTTSLNFCDGRTKGLGDLDLELYFGRDWCECRPFFTDITVGFRFPTADRICDCRNILQQPLGDNGHYQARVGAQMGWDATSWVKLRGDFFYAWVLRRCEQVPASFRGALVRNFGPCVPAEVSWQYLFANADVTFFASDCCGFNIGYQVYHKRKDHIDFLQSTATDFAGRPNQPLSDCVAELLTEQTQHKILAEFFLATNYCELFTGYDYAVAGKNAPVDTDFYLGMRVNF